MSPDDADERDDEDPVEDLFPGFEARWLDLPAGRFFARVGGPEGAPPLLLLHGFPQCHAIWHRVAPALAGRHRVVVPDLKGYGWSSAPPGDAAHEAYAKRTMGAEMVALMDALGHARFALAGHDRGARIGYRLALDEPGRVARLALLDVVPTVIQWERIRASERTAPHWRFLAGPAPDTEREIGRDPVGRIDGWLAEWSGGGTLDAFDPRALALYRAAANEPSRIHAYCEDYRAGATRDVEADEADRAAGRTIACPTLILAGAAYLARGGSKESALDVWRRTFAPRAEGATIPDSGHFLAEENAPATLAALEDFLGRGG